MGRLTRTGALRMVDPTAWVREVRGAMRAAEGRIPDAAKELGVSMRQLFRWLDDPALRDVPRAPPALHREKRGKR